MAKEPAGHKKDHSKANQGGNSQEADFSLDEKSFEDLEQQVSSAARELASPQDTSDKSTATSTAASSNDKAAAPPSEPKRVPAETTQIDFDPANDDSGLKSSPLLAALDQRVSGSAYTFAVLLSLVWIAGVGAAAYYFLTENINAVTNANDFINDPFLIGAVLVAIIPTFIFFAFAIMVTRAREFKVAARAMTHVAIQLADPETRGTGKITTVGQAIRREVNAMNEGIERTIARASELETLVHSEVNALERSYTDNEMRVRGLVTDLSNERDAIISYAERLRTSIVGARDELKDELGQAGDEIAMRIALSGETVAQLMDTHSATLQERTTDITHSIQSLFEQNSENLLNNLRTSGNDITGEIDSRLNMISSQFVLQSKELLADFETRVNTLDSTAERLNESINERTRQLNEALSARSSEINDSLSIGQRAIEQGLGDVINSMNATLDEKGAAFRQQLKTSADEAVMDIDLRSGLVGEQMLAASSEVNTSFAENIEKLAATLDQRTSAFNTTVKDGVAEVNETLTASNFNLTNIIESGVDKLSGHADTLKNAADSAVNQIDESFMASNMAVDMAITTGVENLNKTLSDGSATIEGHTKGITADLTRNLVDLSETLTTSQSALDESMSKAVEDINVSMKSRTDAINSVAQDSINQLENSFDQRTNSIANITQESVDKLGATLDEKTSNFANTAQSSINALDASLQDRTEKMDNLSKMTIETIEGSVKRTADSLETITSEGIQSLDMSIQLRAETMQNIATENMTKLDNALHERANELDSIAKRNIDRLEQTLTDRTNAMETISGEGANLITKAMDTDRKSVV